MTPNANYHAINLVGTKTLGDLGDGITASTVHQIFCTSTGAISITPMLGDVFIFSASTGQSINVVPKTTITNSGTFIGFKAKFYPVQNSNLT